MTSGLNSEQRQLKGRFVRERGFWSENPWGVFLQMDPKFFEAYLDLYLVPWKTGVLPPKTRELVYIAIDAATTHLYVPGIRKHIQNALKLGATKEEIVEVFELVSGLGVHSCIVGMPILAQELTKSRRRTKSA